MKRGLGGMDRTALDTYTASALQEAALFNLLQTDALAGTRTLIVAVSGGCDSVALLHALMVLRERLGVDLHVASLDHGIRGAAGQDDLAFVGELAAEWGLHGTLASADVPALARELGIGIEAAARRARYDFLADVARQQASDAVAVAHHQDDQAETVLMHIARGSGIRGLRGMRIVSTVPHHPDICLIRPLLSVSRAEIEAYCTAHSLAFRHDASNDDSRYQRNFIRREVMPLLRKINPQIALALGRLAESAAIDEDWLDAYFAAHVLPQIEISLERWRLHKSDFVAMDSALRRRLLRAAVECLADGQAGLTHERTSELEIWARSAQVGARRDIGAGLRLRMEYEHIAVENSDAAPQSGPYRLIPRDSDIRLAPGERLAIGGLDLRALHDKPSADSPSVDLPAGAELRLRTRRPGDRFHPKGMRGRSRKLKDWLIDRKVPRQLRDQIPLLCADGEIVAICLAETWHLADLSAFAGGETEVTVLLG